MADLSKLSALRTYFGSLAIKVVVADRPPKVAVAGVVSLEVGLRPGESITLQRPGEDGPVNVYASVDVEDAQKLAAIDAAENAGVIDHKTAEEKRAGTKGSHARARQLSSSHDLTVAVEAALVCAREARDRAELEGGGS